jgi:hypothetical protein
MRGLVVWLAAGLVGGCQGHRQGATIEEQRGAPDRTSCVVDDDCVAAPLVSPDLCCDSGVPSEVVSRAFYEWRQATRASRCEGVQCPAMPSPAVPRPCAIEPRCVAGQCTHSCDEPTAVETDRRAASSEAFVARVVAARAEADGRWLRVEVTALGLVGCEVASPDTSCPPDAEVRTLDRREWRELDERWADVRDRGGCRAARIDDTAWTPIRVFAAHETIDARTPEDPAALHPPQCFSLQHLVGWMTRHWQARPRTTSP